MLPSHFYFVAQDQSLVTMGCHEMITHVTQLELCGVVMQDMLCANNVGIQGFQSEPDVMTAKWPQQKGCELVRG